MVHLNGSLLSAIKWRRVVLAAALLVALGLPIAGRAADSPPPHGVLIVYFDKNRAALPPGEVHKIRDLLQRMDMGAQGRIFVIGYTDGTGSRPYNEALARKRAQAVRHIMIETPGIDPERIFALGKGSQHPIADNALPEGRSRNRRVEIYLSQIVAPRAAKEPEPAAPLSPAVSTLLDEADAAVRLNRLDSAFAKLQAARALGGERTARWNLLQGIAGFYAHRPAGQIWPHLQTALRLEPHQAEAREYLGRLEAREQVNAGRISAAMGQRPETAIVVASMGQMYEYLRLFNVHIRSRQRLPGRPIMMWECRDLHEGTVFYYFDCSGVYDWAFDTVTSVHAAAAVEPIADTELKAAQGAPLKSARRIPSIWESELFK
jgi:hypothetical protein